MFAPRLPSRFSLLLRERAPRLAGLGKAKTGGLKTRKTWLGLGVVCSARRGGGGGCDHGRAGREAREQSAAAVAAAPVPRAGAVSQQNASSCGGAGPARSETWQRQPGPLGRRCPCRSRRRGLQLLSPLLGRARPQAGSVRHPERGTRLVGDPESADVLSRPLVPGASAVAAQVQVRGTTGRARCGCGEGTREEGALGPEPQRGRDEPGRRGRGAGRVFVVGDRDPYPRWERPGRHSGSGLHFLRILSGLVKRGTIGGVLAFGEAAGSWGREGRTSRRGLGPPARRRVLFHFLCFFFPRAERWGQVPVPVPLPGCLLNVFTPALV